MQGYAAEVPGMGLVRGGVPGMGLVPGSDDLGYWPGTRDGSCSERASEGDKQAAVVAAGDCEAGH